MPRSTSLVATSLRALAAAAILAVCAAESAQAQTPPTPQAPNATAKTYFEAGKQLRDQGRFADAIMQFELSNRESESIGAHYNLGICHEKLDANAKAYDSYRRALKLAKAKNDDRVPELEQALELLLRKPNVRLVFEKPLPPGLAIRIDDFVVPPSEHVPEILVFTKDGGRHVVVVSAPGYETRRETVEGRQPLVADPVRSTSGRVAPPPPPTPTADASAWSTQHWIGVGAIGVGAAAAVLGLVFTASYLSERSDIVAKRDARAIDCTAGRGTCDLADLEKEFEENNAKAGLRQGIAYPIGGIGIAAGLFLFFTAGQRGSANVTVSPTIGRGEAALSATGRF